MAFSRLRNNDYAGAMDDLGNCDRCTRPLVEIDHYGERLKGCPTCNRWQTLTGEWCRLAANDIVALRGSRATLAETADEKTGTG